MPLSCIIQITAKVQDEKFAVMIFIHGGSFAEYSGNDQYFGPDFLVEKQVILVTINYRLGVLGFLSLDTPEYSGNMGLKDQQMALKWIHNNIEHFGGDPKRVTLMGHDAGKNKKNRTCKFNLCIVFRNVICDESRCCFCSFPRFIK